MLLGGRRQDLWVGENFGIFFWPTGWWEGGLAAGLGVVFMGSHTIVVLVLCCVNEEWAGWVSMGYCILPIM